MPLIQVKFFSTEIWVVLTIFAISLSIAQQQLGYPPALIEHEIMLMGRSRAPWILVEMINSCDQLTGESKKQFAQELRSCVTQREEYKRRLPLLESIQNQCTVFKKANNEPSCYAPIISAIKSCYGEGTDYFQFSNSLLDYVCQNPNKTSSVIEIAQFKCESSQIRQHVSDCLEKRFTRDPFERSEMCRAYDVAEYCLRRNFLVNCSDQPTINYFSSMFAQIRSDTSCQDEEVNLGTMNPIILTSSSTSEQSEVTNTIEEKFDEKTTTENSFQNASSENSDPLNSMSASSLRDSSTKNIAICVLPFIIAVFDIWQN